MFKQRNVIQVNSERHGSSWFKVLGDIAYVVEQDKLFTVQGNKELVKTYSDTALEITKSSKSVLVGSSSLGYDLISLDQSMTNEPKLKGLKLPFDSKSELVYFFRRDRKSKEYRSGLFDTNSSSFVLDKDSILNINFIDGDVYLNAENIRLDNEGNAIWRLDFDQFGRVELKEVLGVYQNQLVAACSDHLLLSVDVNTGEILHKWQELPGFEAGQFYKDVLPNPSSFVLDEKEGKLIGTFDVYYFEINLESGEITYEDIRQELNTHYINSFRRMGNNPFTKHHLFVTAHAELDERPNVDLDCVLALNRHTKKVDWVHIFKDTGLGTSVPQITSTHLYQLDTENNLHIFERTD